MASRQPKCDGCLPRLAWRSRRLLGAQLGGEEGLTCFPQHNVPPLGQGYAKSVVLIEQRCLEAPAPLAA